MPLNYSLLRFPDPIKLCARQPMELSTKTHQANSTRLRQPPSAPSIVAPPAHKPDNRMAANDHPLIHVEGSYTCPSPRMSPKKPAPQPTPPRVKVKTKKTSLPVPRPTSQRSPHNRPTQHQRCPSACTLLTALTYLAIVVALTPVAPAVLIAIPLLPTMLLLMVSLMALAESLVLLAAAARRLLQVTIYIAKSLVNTDATHPINSSPAKALRFFQESTSIVSAAADLTSYVPAAAHLRLFTRLILLVLLLSLIASTISNRKKTSLTSLTLCTTAAAVASATLTSNPIVPALQLLTLLHWLSYLVGFNTIATDFTSTLSAHHRLPINNMCNWRAPPQPRALRYSILRNPALHPRLVGGADECPVDYEENWECPSCNNLNDSAYCVRCKAQAPSLLNPAPLDPWVTSTSNTSPIRTYPSAPSSPISIPSSPVDAAHTSASSAAAIVGGSSAVVAHSSCASPARPQRSSSPDRKPPARSPPRRSRSPVSQRRKISPTLHCSVPITAEMASTLPNHLIITGLDEDDAVEGRLHLPAFLGTRCDSCRHDHTCQFTVPPDTADALMLFPRIRGLSSTYSSYATTITSIHQHPRHALAFPQELWTTALLRLIEESSRYTSTSKSTCRHFNIITFPSDESLQRQSMIHDGIILGEATHIMVDTETVCPQNSITSLLTPGHIYLVAVSDLPTDFSDLVDEVARYDTHRHC